MQLKESLQCNSHRLCWFALWNQHVSCLAELARPESLPRCLITRSGEIGCCVTVIYFKSEPGSLDARFAGCFGGRPRLALIFTFYFHFTIGRIDYNGVGVRRIENGLS